MGKYENISIGVTLEQIKLIYPELPYAKRNYFLQEAQTTTSCTLAKIVITKNF